MYNVGEKDYTTTLMNGYTSANGSLQETSITQRLFDKPDPSSHRVGHCLSIF